MAKRKLKRSKAPKRKSSKLSWLSLPMLVIYGVITIIGFLYLNHSSLNNVLGASTTQYKL